MSKIIISVATTGSWTTRRHTPYVPITPEEIAAAAIESWREGAAIVHIHARDAQERVTCDKEVLGRIVDLIRGAGCDVLINLSTSGGVGVTSEEDRFNPLEFNPDLVSFDAGSLNFRDRVFLNSPDFLERLAARCLEKGVKPEIECFDTSMILNALRIAEKGLIKPPYFFQFVLGLRGGAPPTVKQLVHMLDHIPPGSPWSICGIGPHQLPLNVVAIGMGGHARTGLEDNIHYAPGQLATSNAQLVARLVRIARECGREPATPTEAREILETSRARDQE